MPNDQAVKNTEVEQSHISSKVFFENIYLLFEIINNNIEYTNSVSEENYEVYSNIMYDILMRQYVDCSINDMSTLFSLCKDFGQEISLHDSCPGQFYCNKLVVVDKNLKQKITEIDQKTLNQFFRDFSFLILALYKFDFTRQALPFVSIFTRILVNDSFGADELLHEVSENILHEVCRLMCDPNGIFEVEYKHYGYRGDVFINSLKTILDFLSLKDRLIYGKFLKLALNNGNLVVSRMILDDILYKSTDKELIESIDFGELLLSCYKYSLDSLAYTLFLQRLVSFITERSIDISEESFNTLLNLIVESEDLYSLSFILSRLKLSYCPANIRGILDLAYRDREGIFILYLLLDRGFNECCEWFMDFTVPQMVKASIFQMEKL